MTRLGIFFTAAIIAVSSITLAHAQSGTFRQSHDLGFGAGQVDVDPASKGRFWQVTEKTMSRLVRPAESGEPEPNLAAEWSRKRGRNRMDFQVA